MTEVIKLINNVETLFNVFVPGALCVWFYTKLSLKRIEYQGFLALSIALGFTIKYCVDYIDYLLGNFVIVGFPIVVVYVIVGILCAAIFFKAKNSVKVREWFPAVIKAGVYADAGHQKPDGDACQRDQFLHLDPSDQYGGEHNASYEYGAGQTAYHYAQADT